MNAFRSLSLVLVLSAAPMLASCKCPHSSGETAQRLDGRTYKVTLVGPGGQQMADDLIFRDGRMESTVCTSAGFNVAPYRVTAADGGTTFAVSCDSPTMGHNEWQGVARDDRIEGTVTRTPKDGAPIPSTFSGTLVH